jgi:hypothetical protein
MPKITTPIVVAVIAALLVGQGPSILLAGEREKKEIGSNKETGGRASTDKTRMDTIRDGSRSLQDRIEKERRERQEQQKKSK